MGGSILLIWNFINKKKISSNIFLRGLLFNSIVNCSKAIKNIFKFIKPHSFCVRNFCCVNYLITIQIQCCKLECCVHTCLNCSGFNLCSRIKLQHVEHLVYFCAPFMDIMFSGLCVCLSVRSSFRLLHFRLKFLVMVVFDEAKIQSTSKLVHLLLLIWSF
mgnify:CR=1 FL=1